MPVSFILTINAYRQNDDSVGIPLNKFPSSQVPKFPSSGKFKFRKLQVLKFQNN